MPEKLRAQPPGPPGSGKPAGVGDLVGERYRLEKPIGEGSFARVFLATQTSVGRKVAVKILNPDLDAEWDGVRRFQEEAKLLARVRSPCVVELYDIGRTANGDPYIAMEYVDGRSLAEVLKVHRRLDAARTIHILLQVAAALSAVHGEGVIHRDLKPGNIMLVRGAVGRERVKILDFGLAKIEGSSSRTTKNGLIAGTPQFMAPEQAQGDPVDHRADLYALGCVAYQMLTGHSPFGGSEDSTLRRREEEDARPLRQVCPHAGIPDSLEKLVMRMLARDPAERFPDADDLLASLVTVATAEGMSARELLDASAEDGVFFDHALRRARKRAGQEEAAPRGRFGRREMILMMIITLVLGLAGGVLLDRFVAR